MKSSFIVSRVKKEMHIAMREHGKIEKKNEEEINSKVRLTIAKLTK